MAIGDFITITASQLSLAKLSTNADFNGAYPHLITSQNGAKPTEAVFPFSTTDANFWAIVVSYAAAERRPCKVEIVTVVSGKPTKKITLTEVALNGMTGGWQVDRVFPIAVGNVSLPKGDYWLVISRNEPIAHISEVNLYSRASFLISNVSR